MVNKTIETYGRLDCAFNNAGIEGKFSDTTQCSEENFDRVIAIDLKAVWLCMKYEIPQMLRQGGGAIVNAVRSARESTRWLSVRRATRGRSSSNRCPSSNHRMARATISSRP